VIISVVAYPDYLTVPQLPLTTAATSIYGVQPVLPVMLTRRQENRAIRSVAQGEFASPPARRAFFIKITCVLFFGNAGEPMAKRA